MKFYQKGFCVVVVIMISFTINSNGFASSLEDLQSQVIDRQQQNQAAKEAQVKTERQRQENRVRLQKATKSLNKVKLPEEKISFLISKLELAGENAEKFQWISSYLSKYEGEKIGVEGINLLIKTINEALIDRGFVTSKVYITEQNLGEGSLIISLNAGVIGTIRFKEPVWGTYSNAFSVHAGDVLNIRDVEQGLEQMKRVPSQDVAIKLEPAESVGATDIVIEVNRTNPWKITMSLDNSGTKDTGKLQASTSLEIDNPFSRNDIFSISYNKDAEKNDTRYGTKANSLYYSIPFGKDTISYSRSKYQYHQTVTYAVNPFISTGKISSDRLSLTHLLRRDQNRKTNLEIAIGKNQRHSYINNTEIEVQRQETSNMQIGINHRQYIGNRVLDAAITFHKGVPWFGAQPGPTDNIPGQATTLYSMYVLNGSYNAPVQIGDIRAKYLLELRAQKTKDAVYGSEFFSIGGRYSVRGFDGEQTLSAENGITLRNELNFGLKENQEIYVALDYGKVSGESTKYLLGRELLGGAIGWRGKIKDLHYDVFIGWPIKKPEGFKTAKRTYGFQIIQKL